MDFIPNTCQWPACDDSVLRHKSYCAEHHSRVYKTVGKVEEKKEFVKLFESSRKLNFSKEIDNENINQSR